MRYSIRTVTPASAIPLPFDVPTAKAHLAVQHADDDVLIEAQLRAAVDHIERYTGQVLSAREMEMAADGFPCLPELISIPRDPVTEILSIAYTDGSGAAVTLDAADWRWSESTPELIKPAFGAGWPTAADERGSVRVAFLAGYDAGLVPPSLIAAVKLMLGHLYANRESVVQQNRSELPLGVEALCAPYRRPSI